MMMLWRLLSAEEEDEFKKWARDNWEYNSYKDQSTWHPVSRMEWARLDNEALKAVNGINISEEDAALFTEKGLQINNGDNNNDNNIDNIKITNFADEIPFIVRKMFSGLDNDINWTILIILKNFGDCSISRLEKITKLRKNVLDYHIKKLIDCGLVENYLQKKEGIEENSFYEITLFALNILNSIENLYWSGSEE